MPSCFLACSYFNPYLHIGPCFVIFALCHGIFSYLYIGHKLVIIAFWPEKFPKSCFNPKITKNHILTSIFSKISFWPRKFSKSSFNPKNSKKWYFDTSFPQKLHFNPKNSQNHVLIPKFSEIIFWPGFSQKKKKHFDPKLSQNRFDPTCNGTESTLSL